MAPKAVELHVGGQVYRVVSSASPEELESLAGVVDDKLREICPVGRTVTPQTLLLVAMSLAHDLNEARRVAGEIKVRSRLALHEVIDQVDRTLAIADESLRRGEGPSASLATPPARS